MHGRDGMYWQRVFGNLCAARSTRSKLRTGSHSKHRNLQQRGPEHSLDDQSHPIDLVYPLPVERVRRDRRRPDPAVTEQIDLLTWRHSVEVCPDSDKLLDLI